MNDRGVVQNIERFKQILLYEGMQYVTITPTDIDGIIEYHDKAWFIYEVKFESKDVDVGQNLLMERFTRDMSKAGKYAIAIIAEHKTYDPDVPIYLKDCKVRKIRINNNPWRKTNHEMTVKELTDILVEMIDAGNINKISK